MIREPLIPQQAETVEEVVAASDKLVPWTGTERLGDVRDGVWHRWATAKMTAIEGGYGHRTFCGRPIDIRFERSDTYGPVDCPECTALP